MPGYISKQLVKYEHEIPDKPQHCPFTPAQKKYGKDAQQSAPTDNTPRFPEKRMKRIQRIVGSLLYYARAVDLTMLMVLSTIAREQAKATEKTEQRTNQLLNYCATNPNFTVRYCASAMILNSHSEAWYLSAPKSGSQACGQFFMGWLPEERIPIRINGAIQTLCKVLKFVAASVAEAELGALFMNCKEDRILRNTLREMGHPQPAAPMHCDNSTVVSIANNTVKRQRSRSMEMRYFWVCDQCRQGNFNIMVSWTEDSGRLPVQIPSRKSP